MYAKEMICCTIVIVVGCLTTISHSNTISESSTLSAAALRNGRPSNFNKNGILRDGDDMDNRNMPIGKMKSSPVDIIGNNQKRIDNGFAVDAIDDGDDASDDLYDGNMDEDDFVSIEIGDQLSLKDQVRMLTKQMNTLLQHKRTERRRFQQDVQKMANEMLESGIKAELEQLRYFINLYITHTF